MPAHLPVPQGDKQSTQAAFGHVLLDLAKSSDELADRIVTTAPDVTQTTNLGGFVNQRGLFRRSDVAEYSAMPKFHLRKNGRPMLPGNISNWG